MKRNVILSFDYELFFGFRSGTVLKTLIEPTNMIMNAMESVGLKGNFFIDVLMIKYLKLNVDERSKCDIIMIEEQLRDIIKRGHRIELHLHPHWIDAIYNGDGTWNFDDFSHYSLSKFASNDIIKMFNEGILYLNAIASDVESEYRVCAFRAGGWAIQPFCKIKKAFIETNVFIDSSVANKAYNNHIDSQYDFRFMPNKDLYHFSDDVCIETIDGPFLEIPIYTIHRNLFDVFIEKIVRKSSHYFDSKTDGTHLRNDDIKIAKKNIFNILSTSNRSMFSFSYSYVLPLLFHLFFSKKNKIICFIDHPKDCNNATISNIQTIGKYCTSFLYKDLLKI